MKIIKSIPGIIVSIIIIAGVTYAAGSLTAPSGAPSATSYTLGDIFNKIQDITFVPSTHDVSTTSSVSLSFKSLSDIYDALDAATTTLISSNIVDGVEIFGVTGIATTTPTPLVWQSVATTTTMCWDGNQTSDIDDDGIWDDEDGDACMPGHGETVDGYGAVEYCDNLTEESHSAGYWRLPTIKEFVSISDYGALGADLTAVDPDFAEVSSYWSVTPFAVDPSFAWYWGSSGGGIGNNDKLSQNSVRCVH